MYGKIKKNKTRQYQEYYLYLLYNKTKKKLNKMKNKSQVYTEAQSVKNSQDIIDFLRTMYKKYKIKEENGIVKNVVSHYQSSPKGKDHIVMSFIGKKFFIEYMSNEVVAKMMEIRDELKKL